MVTGPPNSAVTLSITSAGYDLEGVASIQAAWALRTQANVNATLFFYDGRGQATKVTETGRQIASTSSTINLTSSRSYNAFGEVASVSNTWPMPSAASPLMMNGLNESNPPNAESRSVPPFWTCCSSPPLSSGPPGVSPPVLRALLGPAFRTLHSSEVGYAVEIREPHGWGMRGDIAVVQGNYGMIFWDFSDVNDIRQVSKLALQRIAATVPDGDDLIRRALADPRLEPAKALSRSRRPRRSPGCRRT